MITLAWLLAFVACAVSMLKWVTADDWVNLWLLLFVMTAVEVVVIDVLARTMNREEGC